MKAAHHPSLFTSRAASDVTVTKYHRGEVVAVDVVAAGRLENAKLDAKELSSKPGRKKADPNKFAESENDF